MMIRYNVQATIRDTKAPTITITKNTTKYTNQAIKVTVKVTDSSGIKVVKYQSGKQSITYFSKSGTTLKLNGNSSATLSISKNGTYTFYAMDKAGNKKIQTITITNIDKIPPKINLSYSVYNQVATINMVYSDNKPGIKCISYVKGTVTDTNSEVWSTKAKYISNSTSFQVKSSGTYSVRIVDVAGNKTIGQIRVVMELKAVWISYLEFNKKGYTKSEFMDYIQNMFDKCVDMKMNAVIVQVRPFSDALYKSSYFTWSTYVSGLEGKNPGYDPLEIMVAEAHKRGLAIHAWINPYRISLTKYDYDKLSANNPAKKWLNDASKENDRNVLFYSGKVYYNPAIPQVRNLIVNGVKEIVKNYKVDGIHFDDYFYPTLGDSYQTTFDYVEYNSYTALCKKEGKTPLTIADWRRRNVNSLVTRVYKSIKQINPSVRFGISPSGNINTLKSEKGSYVDIDTWLSSSNYVDYICPQIYWTFTSTKGCPFAETVDRFLSLKRSKTVNIYIGIATYKAGSNDEKEWSTSNTVLQRQVTYSRNTKMVDGYMFFRYEYFFKPITQPEIMNLLKVL